MPSTTSDDVTTTNLSRAEAAEKVTSHSELHSSHSEYLESAVLGMADGLTVPFALTAGLSSIGSSRLVIIGGLAEIFSGMISMGLGEYLSSNTKAKQWNIEYDREKREVVEKPQEEEEEIYEIFDEYRIPRSSVTPIIQELKKDPKNWVDFMMAFELKMEKPKRRTAWICAIIMALSYLIGGIIPMIPYFAIKQVSHALFVSIGITVVVLLVFGYAKSAIAGTSRRACIESSLQMLAVGATAAGTSYGIVYGINRRLAGGNGTV